MIKLRRTWMKRMVGMVLLCGIFLSPLSSSAALTSDQINAILLLLQSFGAPAETVQNVDDVLNGRATGTTVPVIETESTEVEEFGSSLLRPGQRSADILLLQTYLRELGLFDHPSNTTYYGSVTREAVREFQREHGLYQDGVVGPQTARTLYEKVRSRRGEHGNDDHEYGNDGERYGYDPLEPEDDDLKTNGAIYSTTTIPTPTSDLFVTTDLTPRIMYWYGKVNQHIDVSRGGWVTDPDGTSGANLDKLAYCKKWYPNTVSVRSYQSEKITTWREAGNVNFHTTTKTSDECVQPESPELSYSTPTNDLTPRIMYWWGKVNQHVDVNDKAWVTDPDGVSGANLDMLAYCKKWYPATESVREYQSETITTWRERGNVNLHTSTKTSFECVQPNPEYTYTSDDTPRINYWWGKVNQHVDLEKGAWVTDPDGVSGADLDKLTYCKKWYPETVSVRDYKSETINGWRERGNVNFWPSTKLSTECVQPDDDTTTERIMYWWGKVNQHFDLDSQTWMTDPDGVSGANLDELTYCRKWYPNTVSVQDYKSERINTWRAAGNTGAYETTKTSRQCVQPTL